MLSGIGPAGHLQQQSIPLVKDIPGVGESLYDHSQIILRFKIKSSESTQFMINSGFMNCLKFAKAVAEYKLGSRGPLSMSVSASVSRSSPLTCTDPLVTSSLTKATDSYAQLTLYFSRHLYMDLWRILRQVPVLQI